jgi:hypothetical protein
LARAIGAQPAEQESSPCGIFYTSRFYRLLDGADYPLLDGRKSTAGGVQGADLGYLKAGLFRADNRTFSITLAADPEDKPMRARFLRTRVRRGRRTDRSNESVGRSGNVGTDQQGLSLRQPQQYAQNASCSTVVRSP